MDRDELVEKAAREFHENYERLAPEFSYSTRKASAVPWADVPEPNKSLMLATVASVIDAILPDVIETVQAEAAQIAESDQFWDDRGDVLSSDEVAYNVARCEAAAAIRAAVLGNALRGGKANG